MFVLSNSFLFSLYSCHTAAKGQDKLIDLSAAVDAIKEGNLTKLNQYLDQSKHLDKDKLIDSRDGSTLLHWACFCYNPWDEDRGTIIEALLRHNEIKKQVNEKAQYGYTPLHFIVKQVSQLKKQLNQLKKEAYCKKWAKMVQHLINNGAKIAEQDLQGRTPLSYALELNVTELIAVLSLPSS